MEYTSNEFIIDLLQEVERMEPNLFPPRTSIEDTDRKLGEATPYMQKIHALGVMYGRDCELMAIEHKYANPEEDTCSDTHVKLARLDAKKDILMELFWAIAREHFNAWTEDAVGLRKGWIVVATKKPNAPPNFAKFLRFMQPPEE